jgi:flagellar biosynthetic protein FliP
MTQAYLGLVVVLAAAMLLLLFLPKWLRRLPRRPGAEYDAVPLRLVRRISIGPRQGIGLLEVGDRMLVISMAESGARLLTDLDGFRLDGAGDDGGEELPRTIGASVRRGETDAVTPRDFAALVEAPPVRVESRDDIGGTAVYRLARRLAWVGALVFVVVSAAGGFGPAAAQSPSSPTNSAATYEPIDAYEAYTAVVVAADDSAAMIPEFDSGPDAMPAVVLPSPNVPSAGQSTTAPPTARAVPGAGGPALLMADPGAAAAQDAASAASPGTPRIDLTVGDGPGELHLSGAVGIVVLIGAMTLLPALLLLMTSFTRILIVLQFLRPAIGTQNAPPTQLLVALSILLTGVVMNPVLQTVHRDALKPYMDGEITQAVAYERGIQPFRTFMLDNMREHDLAMFVGLTKSDTPIESPEDVPTLTLASAFVTSELKTAFQMGFLIFVPFVVVDLIVASVLMSLGMFMLPPLMVSLPLKLLLFVLADGWTLVVKNLVLSFRI